MINLRKDVEKNRELLRHLGDKKTEILKRRDELELELK